MNIPDILARAARMTARHTPEILTGAGIAGFVTTVVLAVRAAPIGEEVARSHRWIREEIAHEEDPETRKKQIREDIIAEAKELVPLYGPAAGVGCLSIACFLVASKVRTDRQAAILAAYSLGEKTFATYQQKVIDRIGEEGHADILRNTMVDVARDDPAPDGTLGIVDGKMRFYDMVLGRYFYSTREDILGAESDINRRLLSERRVPVSDFYYAMGIENRSMVSECMGWDISDRYVQALDVSFAPMFDDEKNPCTAMFYKATIFDRSV